MCNIIQPFHTKALFPVTPQIITNKTKIHFQHSFNQKSLSASEGNYRCIIEQREIVSVKWDFH